MRTRPGPILALVVAAGALCCRTAPAKRFDPVPPDEAAQALETWSRAREAAATLPPARLLYHARGGVGASIPGTLAVAEDGERVVAASLTGPFGKPIAEYRDGTLRRGDEASFLLDPVLLRSVLSGSGPQGKPRVEGRSGSEYRLVWDAPTPAAGVFDAAERRLRSLEISAPESDLRIDYEGRADGWPARLEITDRRSGRSLRLLLVAVESVTAGDRAPGGAP